MGYEDKINLVYDNISSDSEITYDNIEDILNMLVNMSEYIKELENRVFEIETED